MSTTTNERRSGTALGFEVHKEPWNTYQVSDGTKLRIRIVLRDVRRVMDGNVPIYVPDARTIIAVICAPALKGTPAASPSGEEQRQSVERADIPFETIAHDNNDYLLDDGTRIRMHFNLNEVSRMRLCDANGDRVYNIEYTAAKNIKLGPQYGHRA